MVNNHVEKIKCPECGKVQNALVEHTWLWFMYIHRCVFCDYLIYEYEWDKVEEKTPPPRRKSAK